MEKLKKMCYLIFVPAIILAVVIVVVAVYSQMLEKAVENTTKNNIYEIAALNRNTMSAYVEIAWEDLDYIEKKLFLTSAQPFRTRWRD